MPRFRLALLFIGIILLPAILNLCLIWFFLRADITHILPINYGTYNDTFYYWRQIYTFSQVGFQGGYYTAFEVSSPAEYSHFYLYGPWYAAFYGTLGRLLGWYAHTGILFNMLLISGSLSFWVWWHRHSRRHLLWAGALSLMLPPILFYMTTNMQESLQYSLILLISIPMCILLRQRHNTARTTLWVLGILSFITAVLRPTWLGLFVLLFMFYSERITLRHWFVTGLRVLPFAALIGLIVRQHSASYGGFLFVDEANSVAAFIQNIINRIAINLRSFNAGSWMEGVQRYQVVAVLVSHIPRFNTPEALFHVINLVPPILFNFLFYIIGGGRDVRLMATHLLLSIIVMIEFKRDRLLKLLLLLQLLVLPFFLEAYALRWQPQFTRDQTLVKTFAEETKDVLVYDSQATNAWCNTLLVVVKSRGEGLSTAFPAEVMWIDAGIGISFFIDYIPFEPPYKSRYILLDEEDKQMFGVSDDFKPLKNTVIGTLYENTAADCR